MLVYFLFFFFKQKTAYEMRISDWSSDVCSSDLKDPHPIVFHRRHFGLKCHQPVAQYRIVDRATLAQTLFLHQCDQRLQPVFERVGIAQHSALMAKGCIRDEPAMAPLARSEEHTSELQSLMRISYAVFCLKNTK